MVSAIKVVVSIDPTAAYADDDFIITGQASSPAGIKSIAFRGFNNTGDVSSPARTCSCRAVPGRKAFISGPTARSKAM